MAQHIIYGAVSENGEKLLGEGFRCQKIQQGTYLINFERPFTQKPVPVCTIFGAQWQTSNKSIAIIEIDPSSFVCITSLSEEPADSGFTFTVFGDA